MPGTDGRGPRLRPPGLLLAIGCGLAVRIALLAARPGEAHLVFSDSGVYLSIARAMPTVMWHATGQVLDDSLFRTPGYPAFAWLTGGGSHAWTTVLAQCIVGAVANVWLAHRLASRLVGPRAALLAAWVLALDPSVVGHDLLIATETLATTTLLGGLVLLRELWSRLADDSRTRAWVPAVGAGLTLGFGGLVRPAGVILPLLGAAAMVLVRRSRPVLVSAAVVAITGLLLPALWLGRNLGVGDTHTITTAGGYNLLDLGITAAAADESGGIGAALDPPRYAAAADRISERTLDPLYEDGRIPTAEELDDAQWRAGRDLVLDHPTTAAVVAGRALVRTWVAPGSGVIRSHLPESVDRILGPPISVWATVWIAVLDLALLWGILQAVRRRRRLLLAFTVGPIVATMTLSLFPALYLRFRVPVLGLAAILAASVLTERWPSGEQHTGVADPVGIEGTLDGPHRGDVSD